MGRKSTSKTIEALHLRLENFTRESSKVKEAESKKQKLDVERERQDRARMALEAEASRIKALRNLRKAKAKRDQEAFKLAARQKRNEILRRSE